MTRWPNAVDAPAPRAWDLRDEPVDVETVEKATDLSTLPFRVITKVASELGAEIAVREPVHRVLPAHEGDKELRIGTGHRIERLDRAARRRALAGGDGVQPPEPGG